jgi:toxin-antitoxin system PIN domain toxin
MMFVVDTNILLYAAERSFPEHRRARTALDGWRRGADAWFTTWGILYEFLRVATHARVFRTPWEPLQAWSFVEALLASPGLSVLAATDRHRAIARAVLEEVPDLRGNLVHDAHTAVLMREHGVRDICTRDTDFHRFPFLRVIDPFA